MAFKILFLSHRFFPDFGGIETVSEILATNFSKAGHEVHLVTWSTDPANKSFPFEVIRNPNKHALFQQHLWADLIFENNPCLRLSWPALFLRRPSVISLHTWIETPDSRFTLQSKLKYWWLKRAKRVIACSDAIRKQCPASIIIGNPYQETKFKILPDIPKTLDFVFVGRLVYDKGVDIAIRAFHNVIKKYGQTANNTNLSFTIVGNGPERKALEAVVAALHLEKNIVFTGAIHGDELVECLNRHRFILVPSTWEEPFGIVALEGMACGCLPIVSNGGGLPDAVGKAGIVFNRGEIDDLTDCITGILNNVTLEKKIREAASEHLKTHYSETVATQYLSVIESAIKPKYYKDQSYVFNGM
jgi:glycosyltransferase involved in cell wall biosynthesis